LVHRRKSRDRFRIVVNALFIHIINIIILLIHSKSRVFEDYLLTVHLYKFV